jgi:SET domain-containing protein
VRPIAAGEELFINYNGDFDDPGEVWFETWNVNREAWGVSGKWRVVSCKF